MRFQVYKVDIPSAKDKQNKLDSIKNSYYVQHGKDISYLYVIDHPQLKKEVLQKVRDLNIQISPESYETVSGKKEFLYVEEYQIRKHIKKVKSVIEVKLGDVVTIPKYKKMPFVVKEVGKYEVIVGQSLKDIDLDIKVPIADVRVVEDPDEVAPFYQGRFEILKTCKLFIDCDIYDIDEGVESFIKDSLTIKTVLNKYEIVALNPMPSFKKYLEVAGIRSYIGDKRLLHKSNVYDRDLDILLTDCIDLVKYLDTVLYWDKVDNITYPDFISKDTDVIGDIEDIPDPRGMALFKEYTKYKPVGELVFEEVKEIFRSKELDHLLGDLSYFMRVIK